MKHLQPLKNIWWKRDNDQKGEKGRRFKSANESEFS